MNINKGKLVYIKDKSLYNSNNFLDTLVIFVEDTKEIITHGISFAGIPSSYNMYVGAKDKKANATTTNGNTYIKLYKDSTLNNQFLIKGTGATTVVSDASGNITINSTDSNTWRALQVKGTQIAGTGTGTYPVNFVEGTDITLTGTVGTSTTKLNSITINHADITTTVTAAKDTATQLAYSGEITVPTAITTNNGHITAYTWTKYKLPAASHYTTKIYAGTSGTNANSTTDVSNPYLTVVDNTTYRNQVQFAGSGATSVKAKNGVITISSTNTWTAFVGAKTNAAGTAGYVPAPSSGLTGLYFRSDGTWATPTDTKYTLPTASNSTLGGVKTGAAIDSTSGYTAVHINNGVIYYKNTTYSTKAMKVNGSTYNVYTSSTSLPTIYAPTAVGTAGQVLATNSNADGLEWKSVATTTKAMKVNGTNYNIYTTGTSLPTIYAPTSLGTAGQVLKMNGDGTGFTWATDATIDNTWRPVKALKSDGSTLGTLSDNSTTLSLKAGSNITLAYSNGTITITGVGNTWTALGGATVSTDGTAGYAPKPTKGQQGYYLKGNATWVKPSLSEFTDDVVAGNYLPLSGGTLNGRLYISHTDNDTPLVLIGTSSSWIHFTDSSQSSLGYIGFNASAEPAVYKGSNSYKIWHSGNDGSDSGLDADLLDGLQGHSYWQAVTTYSNTSNGADTTTRPNFLGYASGLSGFRYFLTTFYGSQSTSANRSQIALGYDSQSMAIRRYYNGAWDDWKTIAFTTSNVASATKLQTARTIWGQSFDGTGNVSGSLSGVTDIFMSGSITLVYGSTDYKSSISMKEGYLYIQPRQENVSYNYNTVLNSQGGNVGIGTTSPAYKLDVSDTMQVTSYITGLFINRTNPEGNPHVSFKSNGTLVGDIGFTPQKNLVFYDYNSSSWKDILNANNYTSYTVTKTGGGASGLWGINISGYSLYMNNTGNASNLNTPSAWTYDNHYLVYDLYSINASNKPVDQDNANSAITLYKGWHGTSGAYATQIAFPNNEDIYIRKCSAGSWGSWRKLYHSGNFSATGTTWNGGTVSNTIYTTATPGMIVRRPDGAVPYIRFGHTNGTDYGELGSTASGTPVWWYTAGENSAWRELVSNVSGTAYNSARWGGYTLSVSGTPSNSTITFYV